MIEAEVIELHGLPSWSTIGATLVAWWRRTPLVRVVFGWVPTAVRRSFSRRVENAMFCHRVLLDREATLEWVSPTNVAAQAHVELADIRLFGHLGAASGLGAAARRYESALQAVGGSVTTFDVSSGRAPPGEAGGIDLVVVNPDRWVDVRDALGPPCGRARVACWFWELEIAPPDWRAAADDVDALVLASPFVVAAFDGFGLPCIEIPVPIETRVVAGARRETFGLPTDAFVFLAAADFNSVSERKNPVAAVRAFRQAFPQSRADICLTVKCSNAHAYPADFARLVAAAAGDSRVRIINALMSDIEVAALRQCVDAFVSLHRSEGFGLMIAECMALGKPVLATGWSGNRAFMSSQNSMFVDYRLVPVPPEAYPHRQGRWAEPDMADAVLKMQRLVDESGLAARIGAQAARDVGETLSPEAVGVRLASALVALTRRAHDGCGDAQEYECE